MKQLKRFALAFAALALLAAALLCPAVSAANLDEIEKYFITVRIHPRRDRLRHPLEGAGLHHRRPAGMGEGGRAQ